jgi:hypothetical protein
MSKFLCCVSNRPWRDLKKKELEEWEQQRDRYPKPKNSENGESEDFINEDDRWNGRTCMIDGKKISWIDLSYMEQKHHKDEIEWQAGGPGVAVRKMSSGN